MYRPIPEEFNFVALRARWNIKQIYQDTIKEQEQKSSFFPLEKQWKISLIKPNIKLDKIDQSVIRKYHCKSINTLSKEEKGKIIETVELEERLNDYFHSKYSSKIGSLKLNQTKSKINQKAAVSINPIPLSKRRGNKSTKNINSVNLMPLINSNPGHQTCENTNLRKSSSLADYTIVDTTKHSTMSHTPLLLNHSNETSLSMITAWITKVNKKISLSKYGIIEENPLKLKFPSNRNKAFPYLNSNQSKNKISINSLNLKCVTASSPTNPESDKIDQSKNNL